MNRHGVEVVRDEGRFVLRVNGCELELTIEQADEVAAELRSAAFLRRREIERRAKGRR